MSTASKTATKTSTATRTATSTKADTKHNITVTGGAGRGATTTVTIVHPGAGSPRAGQLKALKSVK